nr:unnamed protein product [Digitaria exilis]
MTAGAVRRCGAKRGMPANCQPSRTQPTFALVVVLLLGATVVVVFHHHVAVGIGAVVARRRAPVLLLLLPPRLRLLEEPQELVPDFPFQPRHRHARRRRWRRRGFLQEEQVLREDVALQPRHRQGRRGEPPCKTNRIHMGRARSRAWIASPVNASCGWTSGGRWTVVETGARVAPSYHAVARGSGADSAERRRLPRLATSLRRLLPRLATPPPSSLAARRRRLPPSPRRPPLLHPRATALCSSTPAARPAARRKERCERTKAAWSLPLRPYGFWTFDRFNSQLSWDPQISQAAGRRDPYDDLITRHSGSPPSA